RVTGAEELCPEKTGILGPCRVIPQEYLNVTCRVIDIESPSADGWRRERLVAQLAEELGDGGSDLSIAYRGGERWVQIFEPVRLEPGPGATRFRTGGVYLITGGLGAMGLVLARHLAVAHRARLVLVGRTVPPLGAEGSRWIEAHGAGDRVSRQIRALQELEERGAEVCVVAADVADEEAMRGAVERAVERFGTLHGVIHAAGITGERFFFPIQEMERETCEQHFRAKVHGLLALDAALRGRDLDFCLLQSSLSTVLGGLAFSAYVAANGFMDAFAHKRAQDGPRTWISVDWDSWHLTEGTDTGTEFGATVAEYAMTPEEGAATLERVLATGAGPQVIHSTGDLESRIDQWLRLAGAGQAEHRGPVHERPRLTNPYVAPGSPTEERIATIWEEILGLAPVGIHDDFFEIGGHSLLATRVFTRLRAVFHVALPLRTLFETATVAGLAGLVDTILWAGQGQRSLVPELVADREEIEI
ncbi:MAG TPA: SDR family NAD(P)-dependent oxidoreductase, partial [Thermoanaerobaculia bacterium]|nr:SDR family NAD(P)-dependent oxidoreductase [Thermoanaerobaculia bacterium]